MTSSKQLTLDSSLYDLNQVLIIGNCQINIRAFFMNNAQGSSSTICTTKAEFLFVPSENWTLSD